MIQDSKNPIRNIRTPRRYVSPGMVLIATLFTLPQLGLAGADDSPTVDWGRDLYYDFCVSCHGWTGTGDGPAGGALKTPPADLTQLSAKNGGEFPHAQVKRYIEGEQPIQAHGSRKMPIWGKAFRRESTDTEARMQYFALAKFLESIQSSE